MNQKKVTNSKNQSLNEIILSVKDFIEPLQKNANILVEAGNKISLIKYENVEIGSSNPLHLRLSRHANIQCFGNIIKQRKDDPLTHEDPSKRIIEKARLDILGTHKIDFDYDDEFGIYLPSANLHTDLYLTLANKFGDGQVKKLFDNVVVTSDESLLVKKLLEITRPQYFKQNVLPFLENESTDLKMPKWNNNIFSNLVKLIKKDSNKPNYIQFNRFVGRDWLSSVAKDLEHGDFVYVGSKEEVYLLGVAKNDDNSLYMQGTYTTSTKPMLWFSNNYIGHINEFDMKKPLYKGKGGFDSGRYRSSNPPCFNNKPFIFSAMGRSQDCKNSIFNSEPDLITGNLSDAIKHFKTTDFNEFEDVVENYANKIKEPTPNVKPNGRFFF